MNKTGIKRHAAGFIDAIVSRLKAGWEKLSALRLGYQLGLVISEKNLRLCLIGRRLHRSRIVDIAVFPMNPENAGDWTAQIEAAARILSAYLSEHKIRQAPVNIGLLGEDIAFRKIYLPPMSRRELDTAIRWEGEKLFPFEFSQCAVDYRVVGGDQNSEASNVGINIVAARIAPIEIVYDRFRAAGLKIGQIGFLPVFMASATGKAEIENGRREIILFLNEEQSMALFVRGGVLEFFQQFVTRPQVQTEGDPTPANLESIASELASFIDLYNGQSFGNAVHCIYLSGRFGADQKVLSFIQEHIGLPCRPITDYALLPGALSCLDPRRISDFLDVILTGMAEPGRYPLAPPTIMKLENRKRMLVRSGVVAGLALLTAGMIQGQLYYQETHKKSDLEMKKAVARAFEQSPSYQGYLNLMGKLNRSRIFMNQKRNQPESHFHLHLKELTLLLPDHVNLTAVDLNLEEGRYVLRLDGHVRLRGFSPEIILADYVESLGSSPFFDNVTVFNYNKRQEKGRFDLTFQLKMDARV